MNNRFLLEIYTEEIPYTLQKKLSEDIKIIWDTVLQQNKIQYSEIKVFSTAKRMSVLITGLPNQTSDINEEKRGPEVNAKQQIIDGFCNSKNVTKENLIIKEIKGKSYYFANILNKGSDIKDLLSNYLLKEVLSDIKFKKSMVWNSSKQLWARPIRNILAILQCDNETNFLNINFAGVTSSSYTFGHSILSANKIYISNIEDYFSQLEKNYVILDFNKRQEIILQNINQIEKQYDAEAFIPSSLLEEIAYLTEYPYMLLGNIQDEYLVLPKELLVDIAVTNQRYVTLTKKDGKLLNKFIIFANNIPIDKGKVIIAGNEQVLCARLQDGLFFYNQDLKENFIKEKEKLKSLNFFTNLGTLYDKTERVKILFTKFFNEDQSLLCDLYKNDLVSSVVFEIPNLQGIMGKYYSFNWGQNNNISNIEVLSEAVYEHYKPLGPTDSLPKTNLGSKLALLDKLDTLIAFFSVGEKPTGSKDPYALRRFSLGVIRIIINNKFDIDLSKYLSDDLCEFISERLFVFMKPHCSAINQDIINDIIDTQKLNIFEIYSSLISLNALFSSKEGVMVWDLYQRVKNLLLVDKSPLNTDSISYNPINIELLENQYEKNLYAYLLFQEKNSDKQSEYSIIDLLLKANEYLDNVLIFHENINIRKNRCLILQNVMYILKKFIKSFQPIVAESDLQ